jgi:hypothetical protein
VRISLRQIFTTVATVALTLSVLYAGQQFYNRTAVSMPLARAVQTVPGVARAAVTGQGGNLTVKIWLKPSATLAVVYPEVVGAARRAAGQAVAVTVADDATPGERATYALMRFIIAQGEATGQYVAMLSAVQTTARRHGERATLVLGNQNLFLTLVDGQGHRLLAVLPLTLGGDTHV